MKSWLDYSPSGGGPTSHRWSPLSIFRLSGLFRSLLSPASSSSSSSSTGVTATSSSETATHHHHKPIARRHSIFKRLVKRATSNACEFATNTVPQQGLRLSTTNLKADRARLLRRRSSAPVTPRTVSKRKRYLSTEGLSRMLARDSYVRRSFEEFAEEQYALENVSFMERLLEWKTVYACSYEEAVKMCETFISINSPLQINISYESRVGIEQEMAEAASDKEVSSSVFDKAASEITSMMQGGVWGTFVSRGGVDRAESIVEAMERQSREYSRARSANSGYLVEV